MGYWVYLLSFSCYTVYNHIKQCTDYWLKMRVNGGYVYLGMCFLDFLHNFLKRVKELEPQDKTSTIGQEVYNQTLAKYHSWFIRQGAILAMYVLPTREVMLQKVIWFFYVNRFFKLQLSCKYSFDTGPFWVFLIM